MGLKPFRTGTGATPVPQWRQHKLDAYLTVPYHLAHPVRRLLTETLLVGEAHFTAVVREYGAPAYQFAVERGLVRASITTGHVRVTDLGKKYFEHVGGDDAPSN